MNCECLSTLMTRNQFVKKVAKAWTVRRHRPIFDRKTQMADAMSLATQRLISKSQFRDFCVGKKRHQRINALSTKRFNFAVKPFPASGPGHDCQPSLDTSNPEQVNFHDCIASPV